MKIYFTASLYQQEKYKNYYQKIIKTLEGMGNDLIHNLFSYDFDHITGQKPTELADYYRRWYGYLKQMEVCVADISFPSTVNIGFEIASILNRGKPVIALYRKKTDPVFVSPEFSQRMIKAEYDLENVAQVLGWALEEAEQQINRRFTFVISPEIDIFLKKVVDEKGISRSEYLRDLVLREIKKSRK